MSKTIKLIFFFIIVAAVIAVLSGAVVSKFFEAQGGVFLSEDAGNTWQKSNAMIGKGGVARANVTNIVFNNIDNRIVYLGTRENSLFKSLEAGNKWIKIKDENGILSPSANIYSIALDPTRPDYVNNLPERLYLGVFQNGFGRVLKSEDGGLSFREVYIVSRPQFAVYSVKVDPIRSNVIWAGTGEGLVLKSIDFGETWEKIHEFDGSISDILVNPQNSNNIFVSTARDGIFKSFNGGLTWQEISDSLKSFDKGDFIEVSRRDPHRPSNIYLGSWFGLVRSFDDGFTWSAVNLVIPIEALPVLDVQFDLRNSNIIYVLAGSNIYKSQDRGETWTVRRLTGKNRTMTIAVDPRDNFRVLVGAHEFK